MRSRGGGGFWAALVFGLFSCVYVPPEPAPPFAYAAPVPAGPPLPPPRRLCGSAWHWVRGHHDQSGRWVSGHCVRNSVSPHHPHHRTEEPPPPAEPPPGPPPPSAAPNTAPETR